VIDWNSATYHTLGTSIRHVEDLEYCSFFNIICCRPPTKEEISSILNNCYIDEDLVEQYIDDKTIILFTNQSIDKQNPSSIFFSSQKQSYPILLSNY
jgi:hypothetical protein